MSFAPTHRLRSSLLILAAAASAAWSAKPSIEERCARFSKHPIPPRELASVDSLPNSDTCSSYAHYFGFGCVQDFRKAKAKAFVEREGKVDFPFRGASLLSMVYANGNGAPRNLTLALKFTCEANAAPAETEARLDHLEGVSESGNARGDFSICDDLTSGYMMGICASHGNRYHEIEFQKKLAEITRGWTKIQLDSFERFRQAFVDYNRTRAGNEVDMTGTARGAMYIEERERGEDSLVACLRRLEKGVFPKASPDQFRRSDSLLNLVYKRIQRDTATPMGTVRREDIRRTQRKWLVYRDSWVRFSRTRYPGFDETSLKDWLTRDRTQELEDLVER